MKRKLQDREAPRRGAHWPQAIEEQNGKRRPMDEQGIPVEADGREAEIAAAMSRFKAAHARMTADPEEAARIRVLADLADVELAAASENKQRRLTLADILSAEDDEETGSPPARHEQVSAARLRPGHDDAAGNEPGHGSEEDTEPR
jgi:hypothetical protein